MLAVGRPCCAGLAHLLGAADLTGRTVVEAPPDAVRPSSTSSGCTPLPARSRKVLWQTMPWVNRPMNGSSKSR